MVRLTVRVDPSPHPPYGQLCVIFVCLFDSDYMSSRKDFIQEKIIFIQLQKSPFLQYCLLLLCHKTVGFHCTIVT